MTAASKPPGFLIHRDGDSVGVAVADLKPGTVEGSYLSGTQTVSIKLLEEVPLGHKLALRDISAGDEVIEYGVRVAVASQAIGTGEYVHVHNVRSARWQNSIA